MGWISNGPVVLCSICGLDISVGLDEAVLEIVVIVWSVSPDFAVVLACWDYSGAR